MQNSIRKRLTIAFIGLAIGPLLLVGGVLAWQSFSTQQQQALTLQQEVGQRVATQVTAFFEELENELRVVTQVQGLQGLDRNQQHAVLTELLLYQDVFEALILLDSEGQEQMHLSRTDLTSLDLGGRAEADEFVVPQATGEVYYSPVRFEESTGEPLMTIAMPLLNVRTGLVDNVLVSEVRIKKIWDLIAGVRVSEGQSVYIVDAQNKVVAHRNPSVVLRSTSFDVPDQDGIRLGLTGESTVLAVETVRFGEQEFNVVVEQAVFEALDLAITSMYIIVAVIVVALVVASGLGLLTVRQIVHPIEVLATTAQAISDGDLSQQATVTSDDELGTLGQAFNSMTTQLRDLIAGLEQRVADRTQALEAQMWQTAGQAQLGNRMRGEQDVPTLANNVIKQLCHYLGAQIGALYVAEDGALNLIGSYAYANKNPATQIEFGQGLVGQAAREKQPLIVTDVPDDYITVSSGLGETTPKCILLYPFVYEDQVAGVVEMGTLTEFTETQIEFLQAALASIAIAFNTAQARARINELLHETQQQAEELQAQGEELRVANEELEAQTESLRASEAQLKEKQAVLDQQNRELKVAQQELETKAEELALSSKYKSEFLANMSHELRTPLNSLLILARMLRDNDEGNLTEDQVESAQVIYGSGNDLLNLINDILDLSKVEAGKMVFNIEPMPLTDLVATVRTQFTHVAEAKGLDLNITLADDLPASIETDPQRVGQIVKNLLSNAFKFTSEGSVSLDIYRPGAGMDLSQSGLDPSQTVAIAVTDTGIGITPEQQKIVFEAFQQADGSTSRQYGGSGLGLAISRELATKLGGQINLASEAGKGSTFTLYLPIGELADGSKAETKAKETERVSPAQPSRVEQKAQDSDQPARSPLLPDDRDDLEASDRVLLVIEDDAKFAKILYDYAHEEAFKCLVAGDGREGLELVKTYRPEAVILDLNLPDISGWEVLETLKRNPDTRHIPVHIMSVDEEVLDAYRKGAMGYLTKPTDQESLAESFQNIEQFLSREIKTLLLVEDDAKSRRSIKKLLGGSDVQIVEADHGQAALDLLKTRRFDCMIVDLNLPDMTGFEVLSKVNGDRTSAKCPVIVYTGRDLTPEENHELMKYADSVIVKGVKSPERLLDETALFLHRVVADMPQAKQQTIKQLYNGDVQLEGKKILIVDDDMRNSFALSKLLSDKGIDVQIAQSGQKALDMLAEHPDMDLVLMDIMMPVMDGYETTRRIRAQQAFRTLPILALTAKAMKGDREKCLEAGASDYLSKPVDVDRLFSMLRVWLYQ